MMAAQIFSYITAFIYFGLGIGFLINPAGMAGGVGFKDLSGEALIDVRATYGGFLLLLGVMLAYFTYSSQMKAALAFIFFSFLGFFIGRVIGLIMEKGDWGMHLYWAIFELVYTFLAVYFIKNLE